jgi:myo-inositol-1(or 4)-monophosphatase
MEELIQFAVDVIRRSGEEALPYYGKGSKEVRFDEGLVTEAELHLLDFFQFELYRRFPDHQLYGNNEERKTYSHDESRYLWVFDAMDGVANFQAGIPIWGMSLALLENFWPIFGAFYMPLTGDLFHARAGQVAYRDDAAVRISPRETIDDESLLLTYSRFHQHFKTDFPGKMRNLGCTTAHICYVAMGRAEGALLRNETYQDLAAARVLVESAGGKIYRLNGQELFLNEYLNGERINESLLVVAPQAYREVSSYLRETY